MIITALVMHILMEMECVASAYAYPLDQLTADVGKIKADVAFITRNASSAPKDIEADKMGEILKAVRCTDCPPYIATLHEVLDLSFR